MTDHEHRNEVSQACIGAIRAAREVDAERRAPYDGAVADLLGVLNGDISSDRAAAAGRLRFAIDRVSHERAKLGLP